MIFNVKAGDRNPKTGKPRISDQQATKEGIGDYLDQMEGQSEGTQDLPKPVRPQEPLPQEPSPTSAPMESPDADAVTTSTQEKFEFYNVQDKSGRVKFKAQSVDSLVDVYDKITSTDGDGFERLSPVYRDILEIAWKLRYSQYKSIDGLSSDIALCANLYEDTQNFKQNFETITQALGVTDDSRKRLFDLANYNNKNLNADATPLPPTTVPTTGSEVKPNELHPDALETGLASEKDMQKLAEDIDLILSFLREYPETRYDDISQALTIIKRKLNHQTTFTSQEIENYEKGINRHLVTLHNSELKTELQSQLTVMSVQHIIETLRKHREAATASAQDVHDLYRVAKDMLYILRGDEGYRYHPSVASLSYIVGKIERGQDFTQGEVKEARAQIDEIELLIKKISDKNPLGEGSEDDKSQTHEKNVDRALARLMAEIPKKRLGPETEVGVGSPINATAQRVTEKLREESQRTEGELKRAVPGLEGVARKTSQTAATALNGIPFDRRLTAEEAVKESLGVGWTGIPEGKGVISQDKDKRASGFFASARKMAETVKRHKGKMLGVVLAGIAALLGVYSLKDKGDHRISGPAIESPERPEPAVSATPDLSSPGFELSRLDGTHEPDNMNLMRDADKPNRRAAEDREYDNAPRVTERMIEECQKGEYTYMIKCIREVVDGQKDQLKKKLVNVIHSAAKERAQKEGINFNSLSDEGKRAYVDAVIGGSGIKPPRGKDPKEWFKELKNKTPASYIADQLGLYSTPYSFTSGVNQNIQSLGVQIKMPEAGKKITPELVIEAIMATLQK